MKSKMSFFDPALLKKNLGRFAPAWAILLGAMLLAYPMTLIRTLENAGFPYRQSSAIQLLRTLTDVGVVFAFGAALIFAALVFKYLHTARAAYMMHAFPMTRSCQFVTNVVSGLLFYLVPALIAALCCLGILGIRGVSGCDGLVWRMLLSWTLQYLFFYGLAVFTMHLTGRTVIGVLSYIALNFVFLLIPVLVLILIQCYFYGFDFRISASIVRLAPFAAMLTDYDAERSKLLLLTAVYALIGVALLALAWLHYRFRHMEKAGDAMVYSWARIAFRLVFTLCCALGLGWILAAFFAVFQDDGSGAFLPYALLGCFLGWFGSSMMLERTIKVFKNKKIWLGFAAFAGVLILFTAGLKYDIFGVQRRVPETADVKSVDVWTDSASFGDSDRITLTKPEQIEAIRTIHSSAVQERKTGDLREGLFNSYSWNDVHIEYHLSNGTTLRRVYTVEREEDTQALRALYSDPELAAAWYDRNLPKVIRAATLYGKEDVLKTDEWGNEYYESDERECKDCAALRKALLADAAAGRLPIGSSYSLYGDYEGQNTIRNLEILIDREGYDGTYWDTLLIPNTATETLKLFEP